MEQLVGAGAPERAPSVPAERLPAQQTHPLKSDELARLAALVAARRRLLDVRLAVTGHSGSGAAAAGRQGRGGGRGGGGGRATARHGMSKGSARLRRRVGAEPPLSLPEWAEAAGLSEAELRRALVDGRHARERLLRSVWPAALRYARLMAKQLRIDADDAAVAGLAGALAAVDRFDPSHEGGASLATFSSPWVRKYVYEVHAAKRLVHVPGNARADSRALRRARDALLSDRRKGQLERDGGGDVGQQPLGDEALEDLARRAAVNSRRAAALLPHMDRACVRSPDAARYTVGLDMAGDGGAQDDYGIVSEEGQGAEFRELARDVRGIVNGCEELTERERAVLALRYRLNEDMVVDGAPERSRDHCAERLGISSWSVRRAEKDALSKLRGNSQLFESYTHGAGGNAPEGFSEDGQQTLGRAGMSPWL